MKKLTLDPKNAGPTIRDFRAEILPTEGRFVKIIARNFGQTSWMASRFWRGCIYFCGWSESEI